MAEPTSTPASNPGWTFLSNHAHVLVCLAKDPHMRVRDVAQLVGITERAVQRIVRELVAYGVLRRSKLGRRNSYAIVPGAHLRHGLEAHCTVGELLSVLVRDEAPAATE